jgi:hypothetical protein
LHTGLSLESGGMHNLTVTTVRRHIARRWAPPAILSAQPSHGIDLLSATCPHRPQRRTRASSFWHVGIFAPHTRSWPSPVHLPGPATVEHDERDMSLWGSFLYRLLYPSRVIRYLLLIRVFTLAFAHCVHLIIILLRVIVINILNLWGYD